MTPPPGMSTWILEMCKYDKFIIIVPVKRATKRAVDIAVIQFEDFQHVFAGKGLELYLRKNQLKLFSNYALERLLAVEPFLNQSLYQSFSLSVSKDHAVVVRNECLKTLRPPRKV